METSSDSRARPGTVGDTIGPALPATSRLPLPTWRLVITLALPVLAQQGLHFIVNLSDRYLAGHLPETADLAAIQAAQTTAHYLVWFIICYNNLVTVGSTALVARFVGAGERDKAILAMHQALLLAVGFAGIGTLTALAGGIDLLVAGLRLEEGAGRHAVAYLQPLFLLLVFNMIEAAGIACLVGAGDTRSGLWVLGSVAVLNVPLAWGFCWGLGPVPQLGFVGIAVGTALSHTVGGIAVLVLLARGRSGLKLSWELLWPRFTLMRRLLRVSVPAGFDSLSIIAGQFWFLAIVNQLGNNAASAHGIALVWEALGYLSGGAFGTAAMALVGQNLGAGRPEEAARAGWRSLALAAGVMSFMGLVFYTFADDMFRVFCPQPEQAPIIAAGAPVLLVAYAMPALASTIVFSLALRGAGDTRVPLLFTFVGFFCVRIPLAYRLTRNRVDLGWLGEWPGMNLGLMGAWWAMLADLLLRGAFFFARFRHGAWQRQHV